MAREIKAGVNIEQSFQALEYNSSNVLVTGKAGTGKSTLLRYFCQHSAKDWVVLAPTGISAINVQGATIHSFFKFPLHPLVRSDKEIPKFSRNSDQFKLIARTDTIVIDEISMVRADMVDAMDHSLRKNGGERHRPFGGKQLIMFGDLFQLPPVLRKEEAEAVLYYHIYNSPYFFDSYTFKRNLPDLMEMETVYRQNSPDFIELLDKIRYGEVSNEALQELNERVGDSEAGSDEWLITLTSTNNTADRINQSQLRNLTAKPIEYKGIIDGKLEKSALPTAEKLLLKEGAQVMFIRNDPDGRWVNGTLGKVCKATRTTTEVELENGNVVEVETVTWEKRKYSYDSKQDKITYEIQGTFTQLPLKLAWAVTIHKSQGLTFDRVHIDLGYGAFAHGQLYVALSRCRTIEGITLSKPIKNSDVIVDPAVLNFIESVRTHHSPS